MKQSEVRIQMSVVHSDSADPKAVEEVGNFVSSVVERVMQLDYESTAVFNPDTGEPCFATIHPPLSAEPRIINRIQFISVVSPVALHHQVAVATTLAIEDQQIVFTVGTINTGDCND